VVKLGSVVTIVVKFVIYFEIDSVMFVTSGAVFKRLFIVVGLEVVALMFTITSGAVGTSGELSIIAIDFKRANRATFYYLWSELANFESKSNGLKSSILSLKLSNGHILMRCVYCVLEREFFGGVKLAIPC